MKIAVFHNLPSGGAKRALRNHVRHLTKLGHLVDVYVPSTANEEFQSLRNDAHSLRVFPAKTTILGGAYSTIRYVPPVGVSLFDLERTEREIAETIDGGDYDVVLSEQDRFTTSPFFLKYVRKPLVYYCQQPSRIQEASIEDVYRDTGYKKIQSVRQSMWTWAFAKRLSEIDRSNASFANYILANSYFSRESIMRAYGLNSFVSYLGVDTTLFRPMGSSRERLVLTVGSCTPAKGFDFIVRSLSRVNSSIRPKLIVVSNFANLRWKSHIEELARRLSVDVEIRSLVEDEELVLLYNSAELVLYAPYLEPFGLVPLEAMACGTPVVAIKEGGVRESVVHDRSGILVDRDEEMFAKATEALLRDSQSRKAIAREASRTIVTSWTMEAAGDRLYGHLLRAKESWRDKTQQETKRFSPPGSTTKHSH
jgi:glycosyltransferase involved in cell wall biosynthesis